MITALILAGCGGDIEDEGTPVPDTLSVSPPGGEIQRDSMIRITFEDTPENLSVSTGKVRVIGKVATISGPFPPGRLTLIFTWETAWDSGCRTLVYFVSPPDTYAPKLIGGTLADGHFDVDPDALNTDGEIQWTFNEAVTGHIALETQAGEDLGWRGTVKGSFAKLQRGEGKLLRCGTTYRIVSRVSDAAGNTTHLDATFTTIDCPR